LTITEGGNVSIYLDVLIIINIYVNYFLLKATAKLTHTFLSIPRCVFASIIGSLFALMIFLPPLDFFINFLLKLAASAIIVALAFGISKERFLKLVLFFYAANFIFAGVIFAAYILTKPDFVHYNNTYFYVDFSLLALVISTIIAYFAVSAIRYFLDKKASLNEKFSVIISNMGKVVSLCAIADTGNGLVDVFSGKPIIVCSLKKLEKILPQGYNEAFLSDDIDFLKDFIISHKDLRGIKLIPFSTINSGGVLPVFPPENVYIKFESKNEIKHVDALIGICKEDNGKCDAIFNPNLII
jgi:stage II sporulation protein GA (sporulation sigma-E factor processing peptidase)